MTGYRCYAENLMRKLLMGYRIYFNHDVLNSDGRRIFEDILRSMIYSKEYHPGLFKQARRNPCLENILKIAKILLPEDEIREIIMTSIEGPVRNDYWRLLYRE